MVSSLAFTPIGAWINVNYRGTRFTRSCCFPFLVLGYSTSQLSLQNSKQTISWESGAANNKASFCPAWCRCQQFLQAYCFVESQVFWLPPNGIVVKNPAYIHVAAKAKMPEGGCFKSCFTTPLSTSTLARSVPARAVKQRSEAHILLKYSHWIASALKSVHSSNSEEECITPKELRKDADMKKHNWNVWERIYSTLGSNRQQWRVIGLAKGGCFAASTLHCQHPQHKVSLWRWNKNQTIAWNPVSKFPIQNGSA